MKIEPPRRTPEEEQKLVVLDCLKHLGPCTELQLVQFLFEHDLMNYFEMMFALNDLCDRGQAVRAKKQTGYAYQLTAAGEEALQLFGNRVPRSLQAILKKEAAGWKRRFQQEAQCRQKIEETDRGEYVLSLTVMEQERDLMNLSLALPARELAQQLAEKWPRKASEVYAAVIRILSEE
ncbi:MAG: DUF4364 family protein [Clostridia bacterium]|nr:DUF4364 family protein [Clostridia bacterium]